MINQKTALMLMCVVAAVLIFADVIVSEKRLHPRAFTREDLPVGAVRVMHTHPHKEQEVDAEGHPRGEMEHYAIPEAVQKGGPIYGVFGYRIVSLEYELPESAIGSHPVGQDFPGWGLAPTFFKFSRNIPYDHFHLGIKDEPNTAGEKVFLIHFMFIPHEEEEMLGLSCG